MTTTERSSRDALLNRMIGRFRTLRVASLACGCEKCADALPAIDARIASYEAQLEARLKFHAALAIICGALAVVFGFFALTLTSHPLSAAWDAFASTLNIIGCVANAKSAITRYRAQKGANHGRPGSPAGSAGSPTGAIPFALSTSGAASEPIPVIALPGVRPSGAHSDPSLVVAHRAVLIDAGAPDVPPSWDKIAAAWRECGPDLPQSKSTEVLVGYRAWRVQVTSEWPRLRLKSAIRDNVWQPGEAMRGTIEEPCAPPGVHAYSDAAGIYTEISYAYAPPAHAVVVGTVSLWGKVVICERGYRAEYGYPKQLCWTNAGDGVLQELARVYGCEVYQP